MQTTFIIVILLLGFLITFQIAKASEYVSVMRGEEKSRKQNNRINAFLLLAFLILGLIGVYYCNERLAGKILPFGSAASDHGVNIDRMMEITFYITGFVFFVTQIVLFWFAFKYQESDNRKAFFYPHNNKLEVIWTAIPAIALVFETAAPAKGFVPSVLALPMAIAFAAEDQGHSDLQKNREPSSSSAAAGPYED